MKKTFIAFALIGASIAASAQTTSGSTTTGSTTSGTVAPGSTSTYSPGSSTSTNTNTNTNSGVDLNGTSTNTGTNGLAPTGTNTGSPAGSYGTPYNATGTGVVNPVPSGTSTTPSNMGPAGTGTNGSITTPVNSGTTSSSMYPGNSNTSGVIQSNGTAGVDYNTMQSTPTGNTQVTMASTNTYAAYGSATSVPLNFQTSFQQSYPTALNPTWEQSGDRYRASFNNMNRNVMVYYAPNGDNYSVALPVLNGYIPEEVVTKAIGMYGSSLYSITRVRGANGQEAYQVNLLDGGTARSEFIGADGSSFASIDVFRHEDEMSNGVLNSTSTNAANADMNLSTDMSNTAPVETIETTTTTTVSGSGMGSDGTTTVRAFDPNTVAAGSAGSDGAVITTTTTEAAVVPQGDQDVNYKHKIKSADGRKMKIKTKDGETRVKGDASLDAAGSMNP